MSQIIVSAEYFGKAVWWLTHKENIPVARLSHLFRCDTKQLHRYTYGVDLVPQDILRHILKYAAKMDEMITGEIPDTE